MCVSSTKFPSQIDRAVLSKVSDMMGWGANCHSTAKDVLVTDPSPLTSHRPCSRSCCMAATGIELANSNSLSHLTQSQAQLGKSNIRPSSAAAAVPGCCCAAREQVNTHAETPAVHTIGSERCQLCKLETWGHTVLEALGPHPAAPALPRPWDCEFLPGKAATPSCLHSSPGRKMLILWTVPSWSD